MKYSVIMPTYNCEKYVTEAMAEFSKKQNIANVSATDVKTMWNEEIF